MILPPIAPWDEKLMFDLDRFFADCQDAVSADASHKLVRQVVARAVSEPGAVLAALGEPERAGINVIYRTPNLTVLNLIWGPGMTIMPHDHRMWAVIGIYTGREDNIYWRRLPPDADREILGLEKGQVARIQAMQIGRPQEPKAVSRGGLSSALRVPALLRRRASD